jgi:hypothetical protein
MYESYTDTTTKYADNIKNQAQTQIKNDKQVVSNNLPTAIQKNTGTTTTTSSNDSSASSFLQSIFNKTAFFYVLLFLGIYIILYFWLGVFFNRSGDVSSFQLKLSRILDFIFFGFVILIIVSYLYSGNVGTLQSSIISIFSEYSNFILKPMSIVTTFFFLVLFYVVIYLFRIPTTSDIKPFCISIIETITWITFVIIGIIDFFIYALGIPVDRLFSMLWDNLPDDGPIIDNSNNVLGKFGSRGSFKKKDSSNNIIPDQVFNINNNLYTYEDAQSICTAYGAKLATYDQIEDAYEKGAEWCNYGWSDGQMIFFPTQKSTWQSLQKDPERKNNCGRPGVNGGFIQNPYVKFGVNCFGKKPQPTNEDLDRMKAQQVAAKSPQDQALNAKAQYWKDNAAKLLQVNSFNKKSWSEY